MEPRTCIVTGANAGIGKAAARGLAERGARVLMACRNLQRGKAARQQICAETGSDRLELLQLDTSSLASVRAFAAALAGREIDVLINNAATFDLSATTPVVTGEGFESTFATNYLGPWLLCRLLERQLQGGRIVNAGSKGLLAFPFLRLDLDNLDGSKRYSPARAYYHSKLAMMLLTTSLAARHPGGPSCSIVRVPAVQLELERLPAVPAWQKHIYRLKRHFSLTPEQMADTYIHLALDGEDADYNGAIVDENRARPRWSRRFSDPATARALWQRSAELTGWHNAGEAVARGCP